MTAALFSQYCQLSKGKSDVFFVRLPSGAWQPSCSTMLDCRQAHYPTGSNCFWENPNCTNEMRILLVEDHAESRRTLKKLIERRGHEVVAVESAEEAEVELAKQAFPFLILDWMLPGKSGVELCRELRARSHGDEFFILLVTGRDEPMDLEEALEAGANDYLIKPLDPARLNVRLSVAERRIRALIERNQARTELQETVRKMTDILEKTSDGFFAVDRSWKFTFVNRQAEKLLGRRREELLGKDLWLELPEFTADD